jgi:hypothetical protein
MSAVPDRSAMNDERGPWTLFSVVDATGSAFCVTGARADYEPQFRRHVAWWGRYARSAEYRAKVPAHRWPVFPVKVVVEPCA